MSLLPKSNDWCRRYSSKFNSGWDIPHNTAPHVSYPGRVSVQLEHDSPEVKIRTWKKELS